ncbi:hypothetical protein PRZ48_011348 [Zasmidium cellare]|uniref:Uncharacterized protein n=1 Tax=Zasmidium cellare TaxID=395010 RepID=A0ABR0E661_ZASCE|nr:hypothetical protein PRZ48_011348 [Zasmidium cellare]
MEWVVGASPEIDHVSKWRAVVAKLMAMTVLMILIVLLRLWIRRKSLHREDWVIVITAVHFHSQLRRDLDSDYQSSSDQKKTRKTMRSYVDLAKSPKAHSNHV